MSSPTTTTDSLTYPPPARLSASVARIQAQPAAVPAMSANAAPLARQTGPAERIRGGCIPCPVVGSPHPSAECTYSGCRRVVDPAYQEHLLSRLHADLRSRSGRLSASVVLRHDQYSHGMGRGTYAIRRWATTRTATTGTAGMSRQLRCLGLFDHPVLLELSGVTLIVRRIALRGLRSPF
ncbi:hypothetical protein VTO73DRAFT_9873 [Trametes versicolor]